jgi:hypothetical protein
MSTWQNTAPLPPSEEELKKRIAEVRRRLAAGESFNMICWGTDATPITQSDYAVAAGQSIPPFGE